MERSFDRYGSGIATLPLAKAASNRFQEGGITHERALDLNGGAPVYKFVCPPWRTVGTVEAFPGWLPCLTPEFNLFSLGTERDVFKKGKD